MTDGPEFGPATRRIVTKQLTEFPGNSHKQRSVKVDEPEAKAPVEKIISGEAVQRKKPLGRKIIENFTGEDAQSAGSYVVFDVLIPAMKNMISDAISQGVEHIFFGESRRRSSSSGNDRYTSYNRMHSSSSGSSTSYSRNGQREISKRARTVHDFREVVIESRGEADEVIDTLGEIIEQFGQATVTDLYDLVGITGSFADGKWGWTDLRAASIRHVREGYLLDLPKTIPLD